jgi:hypothetical protein
MAKVKETTVSYRTKKVPKRTTSAKVSAMALLKRLDDNVSYEDIMYEFYVLEKIQKGLNDLEAGRTVSHSAAKKRLAKWLN